MTNGMADRGQLIEHLPKRYKTLTSILKTTHTKEMLSQAWS